MSIHIALIGFAHVGELLKLMTAITRDDRFADTLDEEGRKPGNMCEVLDRVEEKGKIEGRTEGRKEGIDEARLESIRNIMNTLKMTTNQAMDVLRIPVSEREKYLKKIQGV